MVTLQEMTDVGSWKALPSFKVKTRKRSCKETEGNVVYMSNKTESI